MLLIRSNYEPRTLHVWADPKAKVDPRYEDMALMLDAGCSGEDEFSIKGIGTRHLGTTSVVYVLHNL